VEKTYHGKGVLGELASGTIDRAKLRRAEQSEALAAEKARLSPLVRSMATLDDLCQLMVRATLYAGGYHKFHGFWRRRRVRLEDRGVAQAAGRG
jgi:hypothetical protein